MESYFQLIKKRPDLFRNPQCKSLIRIVTDRDEIIAIQNQQRNYLIQRKLNPANANIGIVYHDQYLMILRDAVEFPNGKTGTYIRTIKEVEDTHGIVILPRFKNQWVVIEHFRHSTRKIELEIPRGFGEPNATPEQNATRELHEEIQGNIETLYPLGTIVENSGFNGAETHVYLAELASFGDPDAEEGIERIALYRTAKLLRSIKENKIKDSFTVFAVCKAILLGYMEME